jgi:hypothetical protein
MWKTNRLLMVGLSLMLLGACGDVCQDGADKFEECDLPVPDGLRQNECNECIAACATEASCDDLSSIAQGSDYTDCIADCS